MTTSPDYKGFQPTLALGVVDSASTAHFRLTELRWRIADRLTIKELAFALDVAPSYLSDVRGGRDRKSWRVEWDTTLFAMADDGEAREWIQILSDIRRPPMSAEDRLARLEEAVRSQLGATGEKIIAGVGR